jgi:hypothetical protein
LSPAFGPNTVSTSSKRIVGRVSSVDTARKSTDADALAATSGLGTRVSMISRARDFPEPGSGERNAIRGVASKQSSRCACAFHSVTAT